MKRLIKLHVTYANPQLDHHSHLNWTFEPFCKYKNMLVYLVPSGLE